MPSNLAWAAESFETQLNMHGIAASIPLHFLEPWQFENLVYWITQLEKQISRKNELHINAIVFILHVSGNL